MAEHTPGPWFYDDGEGGKYFPHVVLGGDNPKAGHYVLVNTCAGRNGGKIEECQANAQLIAAAPTLLAACKAVLELYPQNYRCEPLSAEMTHIQPADWKEVRAQLESAIAAAHPAPSGQTEGGSGKETER